ncbi:MAG: Ig-like domain-containing protein [Clostridia bacterium]
MKAVSQSKSLKESATDAAGAVSNIKKAGTSGASGLSSAFSSAGTALKTFATSATGMLSIAIGIGAAVVALEDYFTVDYGEALEASMNSISQANASSQNLAALNQELAATKSRIKELQALEQAGTISVVEATELNTLQNQNSELERKAALQENIAKQDTKKAASDVAASLNKKGQSVAQSIQAGDSKGEKNPKGIVGKVTTIEGLKEDVSLYKEYKEKAETYTADLESLYAKQAKMKDSGDSFGATLIGWDISDKEKQLKHVQESLSTLNTDIAQKSDILSTQKNALMANGGNDKLVYDINDALNAVDKLNNSGLSKSELKLQNIKDYFSQVKNSGVKDYLTEVAKTAKSTDEIESAVKRLGLTAKDFGAHSLKDVAGYFSDISNQAKKASEASQKVDGSFAGITAAFQSENAGDAYVTMGGYLKKAEEMFNKGLWNTDDVKSVAKMLNVDMNNIQGEFEEKLQEAYQYFTFDDNGNITEEGINTFYNKFQEARAEFLKTNEDGFQSTGEAAAQMDMSAQEFEILMGRSQDHGFDFGNMQKSTEQLSSAKEALEGLKELKDSLNSEDREELSGKFDGWEEKLSQYEEDLSTIDPKIIAEIEFEYSLAQLESEIEEAELLAESTGTREAWGNSLAKKEFARGKLEDQNQFSEVVEPQEFPIYFGVESALHDVQEQIASGELDEDEAVRLAIKANNLEDFMLDIQTAFSEDNPTITPETNTEVADEAWQTWLSSTNGQQIIANILANNEEAISAVAELLGMTPEQVVRLIADSSNVDQAAANKDGGSRLTFFNPVSGELQAEMAIKDGGTRNVKLLPNNQLLVTETTEEDGGERTTTYIANTFALPSSFPTITRNVEYKPIGLGIGPISLPVSKPPKSKQANGTAHSAGTALWQYRHSGSRSYSGGSWGLPHSERALINELGSEIIVRNGRWFTLNNGYPTMASLKAGDIVFNHKQSEALLSRGYVTGSHARLVGSSYAEGSLGHLSGRAYASGTEFKQEFDQIEILIDRMESAFKRISDSIETLSYNLTAQNKQVDSAIAKAKSNLSSYQKAYDTYMGKANAVGLSGSWVNAVQNGSYDVSTITDEDLKDKIDDYKKYYEKALGLQKDIADLQKDLVDLAMKKLSNIDSYFSNRFDYNDDFGYANQISELNSALSQYQNELAKQVSSGTIKQYSDEWYDAQKKIADYTQKILDATWKKFEDTLDHMDRVSDNLKDFLSLKEAKGEPLTEADYQKQIDLNNDSIQKSYDLRQQLVKKQAVYDVGSKLYDSLAKEIAGLDSDIYDLMENNEKLKKSIWETRFTNPFEEVIDGLDATISSSKNLRSLLDKDSFFDESGALTDNGLANLALLGQEMAASKQKVAEYTAALKKLDEAYQNGILSQEDYEKSQKNMLKDIQDAAGDVQDYKDKIIDLYKDQMKAEIDYMDDYYDKRQKALDLDKKYYDFSKKLNDRSKSVNQLKAQIAALQGVNNASAQAELRRLQQELAEKEEDLAELKKDHADDMIDRGYDKLSTGMKDSLNSTMDELTYNASKQEQVVADMLNKVVSMYGQAYGKINEIIANTGFAGSSGFHQNVTDLGTQSGAAGQMEAGSASQGSVQASGTTTGVDTGAINKNPSHDAIIEDISKETDLNNRPVAELTLSTTSLSLTEGKSAVVSARVRPTDAANKTLRWTSSNTKAATVSGGTIKGVKAGSAVITCTTTDGSGISATVSVSVARAPAKPAPSQNSPAYGGIPFRYKKDYYPKNKLNVNSSIVDRLKSHDFDSSMSACRELYNYWGGGGYYSGTYSQNVWLLNKMRSAGYRRGSRSVPISGPDFVHAGEIVIRKSDGGILVPLQRGDGVIPSGLTENLWDLAERAPQLLSGAGLYLPAPGRAHQPSGERGLQAQFSFGTLLNIEGNADKDIVDELKSALPALGKELTQIVSSELSDDYRKLK